MPERKNPAKSRGDLAGRPAAKNRGDVLTRAFCRWRVNVKKGVSEPVFRSMKSHNGRFEIVLFCSRAKECYFEGGRERRGRDGSKGECLCQA